MHKDSKMRGQRSSMKSKSVHRVTEFTFRRWMPTSTCQAYCRACWDRRNGWLPGSVRLAANPEAEPRKRLPEPMADWVDDPGRPPSVNVQESLTRLARAATLLYVLNLRSRAAPRRQEAGAAASDAILQLNPHCR